MNTPARPVRVTWLIKGLGPGGAERLLVEQARATDPDAVRLDAVRIIGWKDAMVQPLADAGVTSISVGGTKGRDPRWPWLLRRHLRHERTDVLHVHSPATAAIARVVVRTMGRRRPAVVYTEHNRWPSYRRPTRWANRVTFGLNDAALAVSDDVALSMSAGARAGTDVVVHGIDVAATQSRADRAAARHELGVADDAFVIGCVANCRVEKDLRTLLVAAKAMGDAHPHAVVVHIGQGPLADQLATWHRDLDCGDRVRLLGRRDDAVAVMAGFDVFTLSSSHEGLPVAVMEAMALGLPSMCTAVGGVPQALGIGQDNPAGEVVPAGDPAALAAAWIGAIEAPDRLRRYGMAALARADRFDVHAATSRLTALYRDLADRR